jgi:hypothetical protein
MRALTFVAVLAISSPAFSAEVCETFGNQQICFNDGGATIAVAAASPAGVSCTLGATTVTDPNSCSISTAQGAASASNSGAPPGPYGP